MKRTNDLRKVFMVALGLYAVMGVICTESFGNDGRRPNVVIIFADDLGYGDLSCYGQKSYRTPNIDSLASQGVLFTDFYVPNPYCAPSRATILTGRYPFRHGLMTNPAPDGGNNDSGLPSLEITLAEVLGPLGYATSCIGKWHLGHIAKFLPRTQGFDEYYGILYSNDMRPVQLVHNEEVVAYPVYQATLTKDYTERALSFIESNRDRPFFLYLPHAMPHKPLAASEEFYTADTPEDLYADVIRELDWSVGEILSKVEELGLDDQTLIIFASDNGPWFGGSTAGLRGMKGKTWEGGCRVPMIARMPGKISAGRVCKEMVGSIDIFPTICELTGAEVPTDRIIDGKSLWPLLTQEDAKTPHEAIFCMQSRFLKTIRTPRWKLHVTSPGPPRKELNIENWIDPRGPDGVTIIAPFEQSRPDQYPGLLTGDPPKNMMLFDLRNDLGEQKDVADEHPEVVERLKQMFAKVQAQVPKRPARKWRGPQRLKRLTGGQLRYDIEPTPVR